MNTQLGTTFNQTSKNVLSSTRTTPKSIISVVVDKSQRRDSQIQTTNKFFNHMLTGLASRACFNLDISYKATSPEQLDHSIVENTGLALGITIRKLLELNKLNGLNERGSFTVAFDEALVTVSLAFDGRAYTCLHGETPGIKLEHVEDILSTTLKQFFEGFAQGSGCAVHIQFLAGIDSHHAWEATFKAFGEALRESLAPCPHRAGTTIGLKGTGKEGVNIS